ncbi:hypothetical protein [Leptolyngbya sp. 'hensonii']|nr:hypothetical protein [Leptolyngbya sp. 'hensonii']
MIQPAVDDTLRQKILSDLFAEWLKQQIEQFDVVTQLDADSRTPALNSVR